MENATYKQKEIKKLRELIKDVDTAMFTTNSKEGLVSRPMKTQEVEFDGDLWFFTKKETDKYHEILQNADVNITYAGKSYVSIRGKAEIVEDINKKRELWNAAYEKLMETSYVDPNVILLKVEVQTAEYWETGNMAKQIIYFYKKITGNISYNEKMNETITLN